MEITSLGCSGEAPQWVGGSPPCHRYMLLEKVQWHQEEEEESGFNVEDATTIGDNDPAAARAPR